eukprot:10497510-Ditylum_brightwellii.AAC.1
MEPWNLNLPSIGVAEVPGSITVTRTVTSVANEYGCCTYKASIDAPAGYTVSVSPSTFKLKEGQSVTFDVTITFTNVSGPVGEW